MSSIRIGVEINFIKAKLITALLPLLLLLTNLILVGVVAAAAAVESSLLQQRRSFATCCRLVKLHRVRPVLINPAVEVASNFPPRLLSPGLLLLNFDEDVPAIPSNNNRSPLRFYSCYQNYPKRRVLCR